MAVGHSSRKLSHLLASLQAFFVRPMISSTPAHMAARIFFFYQRGKRRGQPLHFPVVKWDKHGTTTIALSTSNQAYGVVHPLPGPTSQDTNTRQSNTNTAGQLTEAAKKLKQV